MNMPVLRGLRASLRPSALILCLGLGATAALLPAPSARAADSAWSDLKLSYRQPAKAWTEALPVGNGRLGAMIFGGAAEEHLQLNEDTLWTGKPHDYHREGAVKVLPELRRLLGEGKQKEAEALATAEFMSVPLRQEMYQPMSDLLIAFPGHAGAVDYERLLELDPAVATVRYRVDAVNYQRETFSSFPDQAIVHRVTASRPGAVTLAVKLASPHEGATVRALGADTLEIAGRVKNGALTFSTQVRVLAAGGRVTISESGAIDVAAADSVTLVVTAATNFKNFRDVGADPSARAAAALAAASAKPFSALLAAHVEDHRRLFRRVALDLGATAVAAEPTDARLRVTDKRGDPQLVALAFQYGRYLLIASSRPGDQAANLQGIWNDKLTPPWGSKYTTNINLQMNYWPAEVANLAECTGPLFDLVDEVAITGRATAQALYGARGFVLHHNTDVWRGTAPINASNHGIWPTGGAWLAQHLWEHYRFSGDRGFLAKRAYPVLKEAALFFVDYLVKDAKTGRLVSGPSNSPEHGGLVMGPAMDHQIIRALFTSTADAAGALGVDADLAGKLRALREQIAPDRIGRHGQLQEWLEDKDDPANHHRHVSHLWAVFPGEEITPKTPALLAAAKQSLLFRGDDGTGWSLGWKIAYWARFLDGDHAHRIIMNQLRFVDPEAAKGGGGTYPNLFDAHPPFQIDGNFALTAGVCEMLVQSHLGEIVLLPALPAAWPAGSIRGVRARGGFELDLRWRAGALDEVVLRSRLGAPAKLRVGDRVVTVSPAAGGSVVLDGKLAPTAR